MAARFLTTLTVLAAISLVAAGCRAPSPPATNPPPPSTESPSANPTTSPGPVEPESLITGLAAPWSVTFFEDAVLISERDTGNILEVTGGQTRVVGTVTDLYTRNEAGLLGLAVDAQGRLYAFSTGNSGNRIQRFELRGAPGALTLGPAETILSGIPHGNTHNGGRIAFGPDGMLYATTGDAGERSHSRDRESLAGKILRMTPDGAVPADNPIPGSLVYSYGHRNPQGIAWASDGTLVAAEFGQNIWDELNVITPGGDYGWPVVEGIAGDARFIDPVLQWQPSAASPSGIAIIGDVVYIAGLRGQRLHVVPLSDISAAQERYLGEFGRLRDAIAAPDGTLWLLTNNTDGRGSPVPGDDRLIRVAAG